MSKYIITGAMSGILCAILSMYGTVKPNPTIFDYIWFACIVFGVPILSVHLAFRSDTEVEK